MTSEWTPQIDPVKCTGCGNCVAGCPTNALGSQGDKAILLHPQWCTYCTACEDICPAGAIELPFLIVKSINREQEENE